MGFCMNIKLKRKLIVLILVLLTMLVLFPFVFYGRDWLSMSRLEFFKTYWKENIAIAFVYAILIYFYDKLD